MTPNVYPGHEGRSLGQSLESGTGGNGRVGMLCHVVVGKRSILESEITPESSRVLVLYVS